MAVIDTYFEWVLALRGSTVIMLPGGVSAEKYLERLEQEIEVKTEEITFTAMALPGTDIIKKKSTDDTTTEAYNSWYQTVSTPSFATAVIPQEGE